MKKAIFSLILLLLPLLFCACGHSSEEEWVQLTPTENQTITAPVTSSAPAEAVTKTKAAKQTAEAIPDETSIVPVTEVASKPVTEKNTFATTKPVTESTAPTGEEGNFSETFEINEVLRLTNNCRREVLAPDLILDADLCRAAALRARECAASRNIEHTRPDGRESHTVLQELNIDYTTMGENLAMGQISAEEVCGQWRHSADHRRNMTNRRFHRIGIGLAADEEGVGYWVQIFAD